MDIHNKYTTKYLYMYMFGHFEELPIECTIVTDASVACSLGLSVK